MACTINQSFTIDCRASVGGLHDFKIKTFDKTLTGVSVTSGVATLSGAALTGWQLLETAEETAMAGDKGSSDRATGSTFYEQSLTYIYNKLSAAFYTELNKYHQGIFWISARDNNDAVWLFGYQRGLACTGSDNSTGTAFGDRNGYTLTFVGKEPLQLISVSNSWATLTS